MGKGLETRHAVASRAHAFASKRRVEHPCVTKAKLNAMRRHEEGKTIHPADRHLLAGIWNAAKRFMGK